ncbi:MAG: hypothetical protein N3C12_09515 [Candidatus Binatia bacterium]|nr:hypothetical protein [Candidatus Binatia bacterium]
MVDEEQRESSALRGKFYRGRIVKLRPGYRAGVVEAVASGRRIPFEWPLVRVIGAEKFEDLELGMEVGFDMGWTSKGLRVSVIKVFRDSEHDGTPEEPFFEGDDRKRTDNPPRRLG